MKTRFALISKISLAAALGLPTMFFWAQAAVAALTGPLGCGGEFGVGGCAPYGHVNFYAGDISGSLYEYDSSSFSYSATGSTANVFGAGDLASGQLKVRIQGLEDGNPSTSSGGFMIASATDVFTLNSSSSGLASFTVILTADGFGSIANNGYTGQVTLQLGVPGGGGGEFDRGVYQSGNNAPLGDTFTLFSSLTGGPLMASDIYTAELNTPFSFGYSLRADAQQGTLMDLSNTGNLSFILPEGVSITSMGGYSSVVSVPAAVWLFGSGLLGLIGVARRKKA